jgi:hypothetical protein
MLALRISHLPRPSTGMRWRGPYACLQLEKCRRDSLRRSVTSHDQGAVKLRLADIDAIQVDLQARSASRMLEAPACSYSCHTSRKVSRRAKAVGPVS